MECPNCGGDHFTTLRVPQKNLFNSTLAQPGRTGLVLTGLPPFIVTALPTKIWLCGFLRDAHTTYSMCAQLCTNTRVHCKQECKCEHTHMHMCIRTTTYTCVQKPTHTKTPGHTEEIGKIGIGFDDSTGQIKHTSIINLLEGM